MIPHRIAAKYFVANPDALDLPALIPVFHRWIQERCVDELLIDVADYKHVHQGPGIMLIGHEADYALDLGRGRPGLLYCHKRPHLGDLREALRTVLCKVLRGCHLLETEPSLHEPLTFVTNEVEVTFLDRLRVPNQIESLDQVRDDLAAVVSEIYGNANISLERVDPDPRQVLALRLHLPDAADMTTLVNRLHTNQAEPYEDLR